MGECQCGSRLPAPTCNPCTHLEGPDTQFEQDLVLGGDAFGENCKHHVVDAKQRDEQQCGLGQPPGPEGEGTQ